LPLPSINLSIGVSAVTDKACLRSLPPGEERQQLTTLSRSHIATAQLSFRDPVLIVDGTSVPILWDTRGRPYFECRCGRRVKHLYFPEIACRVCLRLEPACRHTFRSVPGIHRLLRWRRMIGAPALWSAIPDRPGARHRRLVALIRAAEEKLLAHMDRVARDVERRARLRDMLPG